MMLTKRQHDLLLFIDGHIKETGTAPTFTEMMAATNLKSKSSVHALLTRLQMRGFIYRMKNRRQAIEVRRLPDPNKGYTKRHPVIEGLS